MDKEERRKKLSSRKFLIWVVWLIIVILMFGTCITVSIITKNIDNEFVKLIDNVLGWFFAISMMYIGMNVGQKGVFALKDFFVKRAEEKPEENKE